MPVSRSKSSKPSPTSSTSPDRAAIASGPRGRFAALLLSLAVLALVLRLAGLHWGIPRPGRDYPFHPDEPDVIVAVLRIDFASLQLSPRFFNYGSLYLYLYRLGLDAATALGSVKPMPQPSPQTEELAAWRQELAAWWRENAGNIHLVGRGLAVAMAVLTVLVTGAAARRAFGAAAGLLAAGALALAPLHVMHAHFAAVDVPATLWVAVALYCALRALATPVRGWFAAAGAAAGLAAGTKYNAGLVLLAALAAVALSVGRAAPRDRARVVGDGLFYTLIAAAGAFVLATPGILIDSGQFWHDIAFERQHVATGHGYVFVGTAPGWWYHITDSLAPGLGWPLLLLSGLGVAWAVKHREPADWVLLAFVVPYYLLIGSLQVKFARYTLPLIPPLCIWAARAAAELGAGGLARFRFTTPVVRAAVSLIGVYTVCYALALDGVMVGRDNRDAAADCIPSHETPPRPVALASPPWYYTPPLTPSIGLTKVLAPFAPPVQPTTPYPLVTPADGNRLTPEELATYRPRYMIVTQFEEDELRAARATGQEYPMVKLQRALDRDYHPAVTFASPPRLGPFSWFQHKPPPHDMMYVMPRVTIYERREAR